MPGVTTRKPRVNRRLWGCRTALTVCHAISIAMTVVLPAPVASLRASLCNSGLASLLAFGKMAKESPAGATDLRRHLDEPDDGLRRLDLAKEGSNAAKAVMAPVLEQASGFRGHLPLVRVRNAAPPVDLLAQTVDDRHVLILLLLCGDLFSPRQTPTWSDPQEEPFCFFDFGMGEINCGALRRSMIF